RSYRGAARPPHRGPARRGSVTPPLESTSLSLPLSLSTFNPGRCDTLHELVYRKRSNRRAAKIGCAPALGQRAEPALTLSSRLARCSSIPGAGPPGDWSWGDWSWGDWSWGDWSWGDWSWDGGAWHGGAWHGGAWHGGAWHGGRAWSLN